MLPLDNIDKIIKEDHMAKSTIPSIPDHFSKITDPRKENRRHKLIDILTIAICAVICNADGYEHIVEFGKAKYQWLKQFLELPHGIPSTDTFERVFARIDPDEFRDAFMNWVAAIEELTKGEIVSMRQEKGNPLFIWSAPGHPAMGLFWVREKQMISQMRSPLFQNFSRCLKYKGASLRSMPWAVRKVLPKRL